MRSCRPTLEVVAGAMNGTHYCFLICYCPCNDNDIICVDMLCDLFHINCL